jgi:hypothetical protein
MSAEAEECRTLAAQKFGETGWVRVTGLAKGGFLATGGRTIATGSGTETLVTVSDATSDTEAWTRLTAEVRAWQGPPPPRRRER